MRALTTRFIVFIYFGYDPGIYFMAIIQALHDTFAAFGSVLSCKVATDEHGNSKGYGFVHYDSAEAADSAIKAVNGMLLNDKKVYVGHHISRKVGSYQHPSSLSVNEINRL